jgi:ribosomal protein S18 acetylase RimI-like enzyme
MLRQRRVGGVDYLALVTDLLQAARRQATHAGVWEAADLQWSWRRDQHHDAEAATFWLNGSQPVAAVVSTDLTSRVDLDILRVDPGSSELLDVVWPRVMERVEELADSTIEMLIDEADSTLAAALGRAGFVASDHSDVTTWMDAGSRPSVTPPPAGFRLVSRDQVGELPHHMIARNGDAIGQRLAECSLYRPDLDLAVYDGDGAVAAYGLFSADPQTGVGLVEPIRTEDAFQQRGLARAVLTAGLDRLAAAGCKRFKVSYEPDNAASRHLYLSTGFIGTSTSRTWSRSPRP